MAEETIMADSNSVHIGGDADLTRSAIAGRDASVVNRDGNAQNESADVTQLRAHLTELLDQVRSADAELPDRDAVAANIDAALRETAEQQPDRRRLSGILQNVSQALAGLGSLSHTAAAINSSVDTIFGE